MSNEIETNIPTEQVENENQQYIDAIRDLKANSVSKARYDKLVEENKTLLNSLINEDQIAAAIPQVQSRTAAEIAEEMGKIKSNIPDIEYVSLALEFRDAVLEETGEDCFVAKGHGVTPTVESYANAQKTADIYKECIEYANGDNKVFINELQRRMTDNTLANINNRRK